MIENRDFREVHLIRCSGIQLKNIRTQKVVLEKSDVTMENVKTLSEDWALEAKHSSLMATHVQLRGKRGIHAHGSRLDFVGLQIDSEEEAIRVAQKSQLLFSISEVKSPLYEGYLHGSHRVSKTLLDEKLARAEQL